VTSGLTRENTNKMKTLKRLKMKTLITALLISMSALAFSQGEPCENKYGKDSVETVKNLSLFNQYFQMKKYPEAYPYWKYLFENAPCIKKRITYNAPTILKSQLKHLKTTDDEAYKARFDGIVDTIFMSYEARIKYWGSAGYVYGKYANDLAKLRPSMRDSAMRMFKKSIEIEGMKTDDRVPMYYIQAAIKEVKKGNLTEDSLYSIYFEMLDIISYNIKQNKSANSLKEWTFTETTVNAFMKPYLECDKLKLYFEPKIDADKEDIDLLKRSVKLMEIAGCEKEDFYIEVAELIYSIEPSSESAMSIAKAHHAKKNYDKAMTYYEKGVGGIEDAMEKSDVYLTMANLLYKQGKYATAKGYASQSIEHNAANGSAYLIIAQYYGNSSSSCTADKLDGRSVFWAAVDKCQQAKAQDPSVAEDANKLIAVYTAKFPKKEDAFFKGFTFENGDSYTVPCLGVSTTVRYKG